MIVDLHDAHTLQWLIAIREMRPLYYGELSDMCKMIRSEWGRTMLSAILENDEYWITHIKQIAAFNSSNDTLRPS